VSIVGAALDSEHLLPLVHQLPRARVLVVGDVMLDRYVYGTVERISPEAPIPVLAIERELAMPGGAGNVARNLAALGAKVSFAAAIGRDTAGGELERLLADERAIEPLLVVEAGRRTTVKTRFVGASQQLLRADSESRGALSETGRRNLMLRLDGAVETCDVLVLSDYGKGILEPDLVAELVARARRAGKPCVVDPKGRDWERYRGALVVTPNRHELAEASGLPVRGDEEIEAAARRMAERCGIGAVLATRGAEGMTLVPASGEPVHLPARALEVFDVSGAGDTVVATLAAALAVGAALPEAMALANAAAGVVVGKLGTATCSLAELGQALRQADDPNGHTGKVADTARAAETVAAWRASGARIGFTNGCFDLLHPGHVSLMRQARSQCDRLVVGLNTDASVRRLKGPTRPVNDEQARAAVLASLADVDLVVPFDDDTPLSLITALRPDVLVKGADYREDQVVGGEEVRSWGGKVVLADLAAGFSTTATIARMGNGGRG
jgi:D-beta-D-heptose 7-phosphate kinase/D-beta-D-heptose 1-phosphate adenosyltransferase